MADEVQRATRRAYQYWYEDGFSELATGGLFLLTALFFAGRFWMEQRPTDWAGGGLLLGLALALLAGVLALRPLIEALKNRVTYPRTGYVAYRPLPGWRRWGRMVSIGTAMAAASLLIPSFFLMWKLAAMGAIIGAVFFGWARRIGLIRLYGLALLSFLVGGGVAWSGLGENAAIALYFSLMGVGLLGTGGLALRRYLRAAGPPEEIGEAG